jgi:hypothetical protein
MESHSPEQAIPPKIRYYDWHARTSIFQAQESKLFDPDIQESILFLSQLNQYDFATPAEKYDYINTNMDQYNRIYTILGTFKLIKKKDGENSPEIQESNVISTLHMEQLQDEQIQHATLTLLLLLNEGRIWTFFADNYLFARVFYKKKKETKPLTSDNSRCLVDCHNILKYITRYIKYHIIDPVYESGANLVNTDINQARKCITRSYSRTDPASNEPIYYTKLCFESIGNIAMIVKSTPHPYIALDLTNAYNNVIFDKAYPILEQYLTKRFPDPAQANYAKGIIRLCNAIKYKDAPLEKIMRRNKGIPQGSPISMDLFIILMDHLIKTALIQLDQSYNLQHNRDIQVLAYVDDVTILFITPVAQRLVNDVFACFDQVFSQFQFQINACKCYKSTHPAISHCFLKTPDPDEKYLGIYLEQDPATYLKILESTLAIRFHQNPDFHSLHQINTVLPAYKANPAKERFIRSLRGIFQYRLRPFATNRAELNTFFVTHNLPNIAECLF